MRICEISFGGEIGTRPAVILKTNKDNLEVMKVTTKAKATDYNKTRLSGFSGVRGYVVTNCVYTVPKKKVVRYTGNLFDCESRQAYNSMKHFQNIGRLEKIKIN